MKESESRPFRREGAIAQALILSGAAGVIIGLAIILFAWTAWSGCRATPGCFFQDTRDIAMRYLWGLGWVVIGAVVLAAGLSNRRDLRMRRHEERFAS